MIVLGINGIEDIFHDASASLVVDGEVIASVEEERFNRKKHSNGVPYLAIEYCLAKAGIRFSDIDLIGYYLDPEVLQATFYDDVIRKYGAQEQSVRYMKNVSDSIRGLRGRLTTRFEIGAKTKLHFLNHHLCHAASAFYVSGMEHAAVLTIDGSGDRESASLFAGSPNGLKRINDFMVFPESLGFIYTTFAAHLGLGWIEGPGKLMGLAAFGTPDPKLFADIVLLEDDPQRPVRLNLDFFEYHLGRGELPARTLERFCPKVEPGTKLSQAHFDLAATVQQTVGDALMHIVRQVPRLLPGERNLCYAGGLALNVLTNRRIRDSGLFDRLFVAPPAYDGGCSLGAALHLSTLFEGFKLRPSFCPYTGPDIERDYDVEAAIRARSDAISAELLSEEDLPVRAAADLAAPGRQKIIGWAQGRMECGPRALGNRSILTSPIPADAKDQLNTRVKKREGFRPYAPSVLKEDAPDWFDLDESRYMLLEAQVLAHQRARVPGITHVDGSSRPQTVTQADNCRYYRLIRAFKKETGVPMVLNTSFNRHGEAIVNRPEEAIAVLTDTDMDVAYVGRWRIVKRAS